MQAARVAAELGYSNLYVLHEGMPVWEEKGYAVYAGPNYEKKIETTKIDPQEIRKLMETKAGTFTLVDVRDPEEFAGGHIPGAIHFEGGRVAWEELPFPFDKPLAIQCASGNRSMSAISVLLRRGYHNVIQVEGGINKWQMHGFPITKEDTT